MKPQAVYTVLVTVYIEEYLTNVPVVCENTQPATQNFILGVFSSKTIALEAWSLFKKNHQTKKQSNSLDLTSCPLAGATLYTQYIDSNTPNCVGNRLNLV